MQFFSDVSLFLHFWQTHIHMCINITDIRLHTFFYFIRFFYSFALDAIFFPLPRSQDALRLVDGEMVIRFGLVGCVLF